MAEKLHQQQQQQQQKHNQQQQGGQDGRRGSSNSSSGGRADGEGHHDHLSSPQEYSCEICGASGFSDELMRDHTRTCHIEGNAQCPFCGLSGIASAELLLHVNQAHLDYLTPDNELMNFIDDQSPSIDGDSDSISECRGLSPSITEIPGLINNNNNNNNNHNINNTIDNIDVNHNNSNINDNYNINNYKCNNNNSPLHSNDNHQQCLNRNINNKQYQMTNVNFYQNGTTKKAHHQSSGPATSISTTSSSSSSSSLLPSTNISSNTRPMNQLCSIQSASTSSSSTSSSTISSSSSTAASLPNGDYHTAGTNPEGPNCTEEKAIVERNQNGSQGSPLRSQLGLNLKSHVTISPITIVTTTTTTQTTTTTTTTTSSSSTSTSSKSNTTKLKPIQSPLQCPLCPYTSDKANVLEEHINRLHFDPLSPSLNSSSFIGGGGGGSGAASSSSSLLTNGNGNNNNNNNITTNHSNILNAFGCPLCVRTFESASDLELHVNIEHKDILSPAKIDRNETVFEQFNGGNDNDNGNDNSDPDDHDNDDRDRCRGRRGDGGGARAQFKNNATTHHKIVNEQQQQQPTKVNKNCNNQSNYCPICNILLDTMNTKEMELHIEGHFSKSPTYLTAKELTAMTNNDGKQIEYEKEAQKLREQREFEMLRAQYGMDDQGNFREQSAAAMQRAVYAGEMSVADYYERQVGLRAAESHGIDDGTSCTKSVVARVLTLSSTSPAIVRTLLCSAVDHYASSYGDKGWGCGYRNLQMILSSLLQNTTFNEALYSAWGKQGPSRTAMPSISRLQKMVEAAWTQGFDVQGSEQLGCKLYNTRKWIGATEVLTVLSWLRINCQLIDFHRPTASDGRHPELFNWVLRYFDEPKIYTPPLYLQHQGHSRTIIGIEQRVSGLTLLVLDPSHGPRQVAALGASQESLRLIRRGSSAMRAPQYQIVAVKGLIDTEEQYQASKVLRSIRIPSDC